MAYTMRTIKQTNRMAFCNARHFLGVFERVYALHPLADIAGGNACRKLNLYRISRVQVVLEGVAQRFTWPSVFMPLNFAVSQLVLLGGMCRLIRRRSILAVYATDPYYSGLFGLAIKFITGTKLVVLVAANFDEIYEATGIPAYPRLFRFRCVENAVARLVLTFADLVAGGNQNNLRFALNHGARASRSTSFTSALNIDENHHLAVSQRDYSRLKHVFVDHPELVGHQRLVLISRLVEMKLPQDALAAMQIAMETHPDVVGVVAGDGAMRAELEDWVRDRGLASRIIFAGNVEQATLAALIPESIILSPLTGMALIEAGLGAAAIVAYDRDWQADFISDGVDGYIVPFKDVHAMSQRINQLLDDANIRGLFSQRIRNKALQMTSPQLLQLHFEEQWSRILPCGVGNE
jgi:glycosyltransferase involved in cell wall biosynthesis